MSTKRQYERFLRNVPIFGDLESQTLLMLADAFIEEKFKAGQNIIKQGDLGLKMYVLKEGICEAIIHGGEGDKVVRKYDLEGMYFGEIAALMGPGTGRSATVRAKNECTVLSLDKPDFDRIMGDSKIREVLLENKHKLKKTLTNKILVFLARCDFCSKLFFHQNFIKFSIFLRSEFTK